MYEIGKEDEAKAVAEEVLGLYGAADHDFPLYGAPDLAWMLCRVGWEDRLRSLVALRARDVPWFALALAVTERSFARAAEISAEMGFLTGEAYARLRAAEEFVAAGRRPDADEQLHRALAFYRSVGASRYVRQGEELLAATA